MRWVDPRQELQSSGIELSLAFLEVVAEVLAMRDVLVLLVDIVDVLTVDTTHHSQGLLATLDTLSRHFTSVAQVLSNLDSHLVGDDLVGKHGYLLT
jgi:UDP-2,3-diacylglucosamine pyrophosphatase LpxH